MTRAQSISLRRHPPDKYEVKCRYCDWHRKAFYKTDLAEWLQRHYQRKHAVDLRQLDALDLIKEIPIGGPRLPASGGAEGDQGSVVADH